MEKVTGKIDTDTTKEETPTILFAQTAQEIYNHPRRTYLFTNRLHSQLEARYRKTGLCEHRPEQADYLEMRAVYDSVVAPLLYGAQLALTREMLLSIEQGWPLAPSGIEEMDIFDDQFSQPYAGVERTFIRTLHAWSAASTEKFLLEIENDSSHWYRPIWDALVHYHPVFCNLEKGRDERREPPADAYDAILRMTIDDGETFLGIFRPVMEHLPIWGNEWSEDRLGSLLRLAEEISWAASTKDSFMRSHMHRRSPPKRCILVHEKNPGRSIYRHGPIQSGFQNPPGYCPANVLLCSPFPEDRNLVEALFVQASRDSGVKQRWAERPFGTARVSEMKAILVAYVASEILCGNSTQ